MEKPTEKKRWGRRLGLGIIAYLSITAALYFLVTRGADIEWFKIYSGYVTLLALFTGGYLTATDIADRWKK